MCLLTKLFLLLRMSHWSKGIFVLLGVIYANTDSYWVLALFATIAFCLISSAVYIYNDLQDIDEDRVHPKKSQRPLASGKVTKQFAVNTLVLLLIIGMSLAFLISMKLFMILVTYLLINFLYNHYLRSLPLFDVLCIASGFMLRIFAGTVGIGLPITWWLATAATLLSLYIALCKRRLEMKLGNKFTKRAVLRKYNPYLLDVLIAATAMGCFMTYLFYTVYARDELFYFILTLPFCAIGLGRSTYLAIKNNDNDDPVSLFLTDNISRFNLLCFFSLTIAALLK